MRVTGLGAGILLSVFLCSASADAQGRGGSSTAENELALVETEVVGLQKLSLIHI